MALVSAALSALLSLRSLASLASLSALESASAALMNCELPPPSGISRPFRLLTIPV